MDEYVPKFHTPVDICRRHTQDKSGEVHVSEAVRLMSDPQVFGMFNASVEEYLAEDRLSEEWLEVKRGLLSVVQVDLHIQ